MFFCKCRKYRNNMCHEFYWSVSVNSDSMAERAITVEPTMDVIQNSVASTAFVKTGNYAKGHAVQQKSAIG